MPTFHIQNHHKTRNTKIFNHISSTSVKLSNSFFPLMAKKFENLPKSCRSKVDSDLFKEELRNYLVPKKYKFLSRGNKDNCKLLTQI